MRSPSPAGISLQTSSCFPLALTLLLLHCTTCCVTGSTKERNIYPLRRPLTNLYEAAHQTVGRDGPRYPDEGFLSHVKQSRGKYDADKEERRDSRGESCARRYVILTVANNIAMKELVPLLLHSLSRIPVSAPELQEGGIKDKDKDKDTGAQDLTQHTVVMGVTTGAERHCAELQQDYSHVCLADAASGLHDGELSYPSHQAFAYGMAKMKYIVNALTTGSDVLYLDADVVVLRDPFPVLLKSGADIAVAVSDCGSPATEYVVKNATALAMDGATGASAEQRALQAGSAASATAAQYPDATKYTTGVTFYRSNPGALRCAYSLLLDMSTLARQGDEAVWEQERFAAFVPMCAQALDMVFVELPQEQFGTVCGAGAGYKAGAQQVVVHAASPDTQLSQRAEVMRSVLGVEEGQGDGTEGKGKGM